MTQGKRTAGIGAILALAAGAIGCAGGESPAPDAADQTAEPTIDQDTDAEAAYVTPYLTWVVQDGENPPVLCLGPHPRPAPTSCDGATLVGWDWDAAAGADEQVDSVRRGEFIVTGDYSAEESTLTVASVGTHGPEAPQSDVCPDGSPPLAWHERPIFGEAASQFVAETFDIFVPPGYSDECGRLTIGVGYDDGSIQAELDEVFGEGAARVASALGLRQ